MRSSYQPESSVGILDSTDTRPLNTWVPRHVADNAIRAGASCAIFQLMFPKLNCNYLGSMGTSGAHPDRGTTFGVEPTPPVSPGHWLRQRSLPNDLLEKLNRVSTPANSCLVGLSACSPYVTGASMTALPLLPNTFPKSSDFVSSIH